MTEPTDPWYKRAARKEPLLTRAFISALVLAAAALVTRYAGFELDQDTIVAVLLGWLGVTGAVIRDGVWSPAAVEREKQQAADEALLAAPIAQATVYQVGDVTHVDVDPVAPVPTPPSGGRAEQNPGKPRAGLLDDPPPDRCPSCGAPILYATTLNQRNGRWTVLPLEAATEPDVEADWELSGDTHAAADMLGNPAGVLPVAVYANSSTGNNWRTHPPSHFLGHDH